MALQPERDALKGDQFSGPAAELVISDRANGVKGNAHAGQYAPVYRYEEIEWT